MFIILLTLGENLSFIIVSIRPTSPENKANKIIATKILGLENSSKPKR